MNELTMKNQDSTYRRVYTVLEIDNDEWVSKWVNKIKKQIETLSLFREV